MRATASRSAGERARKTSLGGLAGLTLRHARRHAGSAGGVGRQFVGQGHCIAKHFAMLDDLVCRKSETGEGSAEARNVQRDERTAERTKSAGIVRATQH